MQRQSLNCSEQACRKRALEAKQMSFENLQKQLDVCNGCGDWLMKSNETATATASRIGSIYAFKFNEVLYKR